MDTTTLPDPPPCPEGHTRDPECLAKARTEHEGKMTTAAMEHAQRTLDAMQAHRDAIDAATTREQEQAAHSAYAEALAESALTLSARVAAIKQEWIVAAGKCCKKDAEDGGEPTPAG